MISVTELEIKGAWLFKSSVDYDSRGYFREWYKSSNPFLSQFSTRFNVSQANLSVSKKTTLRGLHYSLSKSGQAKIITCLKGSAFDVIVDVRIGSPTFGSWISVDLKPEVGNSVYLSSGLAHGVMALKKDTVISYLLSSEYSPQEEHIVNPFDKLLDIKWPLRAKYISNRDSTSLSLRDMQELSLLPLFNIENKSPDEKF